MHNQSRNFITILSVFVSELVAVVDVAVWIQKRVHVKTRKVY